MNTKHFYVSLVFSLIFFFLLKYLPGSQYGFRGMFALLAVLVTIIFFYNRKLLAGRSFSDRIFLAIKPVLAIIAALSVFLVSPLAFAEFVLILAGVVIFFLSEYFLTAGVETFSLNLTLLIIFGLLVGFSALRYYFPPLAWLATAGAGLATFFSARIIFVKTPKSGGEKLLASLLIAFLTTSFFWASAFLPPHFSVTAFLSFNFFYFFTLVNYDFYFGTLTRKKLQLHAAVVAVSASLVGIFSPWLV